MSHCTGCGDPFDACPTGGACTGTFEPPRYCFECGRRLRVLVVPTGWTASCRDHGPAGHGEPPATHPGAGLRR